MSKSQTNKKWVSTPEYREGWNRIFGGKLFRRVPAEEQESIYVACSVNIATAEYRNAIDSERREVVSMVMKNMSDDHDRHVDECIERERIRHEQRSKNPG